jgi:small GTP-binding protein
MRLHLFRKRRKDASSIPIQPKLSKQIIYSTHSEGSYDAMFKIVLFGDIIEGREELARKFMTNLFLTDTKMTIGVDFETKDVDIDQKKVRLQIWDFDSNKRFRILLPTYVRGSRGGLFLYNVNNEESLTNLDEWLSLIKKNIKETEDFPILVVGINTDESDQQRIPVNEAIKIAKMKDVYGLMECSVKTGENVEKVFVNLTKLILKQ